MLDVENTLFNYMKSLKSLEINNFCKIFKNLVFDLCKFQKYNADVPDINPYNIFILENS